MTSSNAATAARRSSVRPVDKPLYWVGADRVLLDDTSRFGLRRKVIARRDGLPDMMAFLQAAFQLAGKADVCWWLVERNGYWFLWIVWKVKDGKR